MTTGTNPRKRAGSRRWWWIGGGVVAILLLGVIGMSLLGNRQPVTAGLPTGWKSVEATTGTIDATVSATGNVEPEAQAEVRFSVDGTVTEVLVKPGDLVKSGQPLARLDAVDLQLALERAKSDLKQATADYDQVVERATPQELAEAQARVAQAEAQYRQASGAISQADINAARARLESARAELAALEAGNTDLVTARNDLARAEAQYNSRRDELSLAKTNAQFALDQVVNELTAAQSAYATAKSNWDYVQETGQDPANPTKTNAQGKSVPNKVNDSQRQQYYDAFVQAEARLRTAESNVEKARVSFDQARQAEVSGLVSAARDLDAARQRVAKLEAGGQQSQLATARAAVADAQAQLNKLTGPGRAGELAASQAGVDSAKAALEKLTGDPSVSALARAEAGKERAAIALRQAERDLAKATLVAPFDGTVARVDLRVGERAGQTAVALANLSVLYVTVPVDELDIAQVKENQPVLIAIDALPGQELQGVVNNIEPLATKNAQGTNTYKVKVTLTSPDPTVRSGMTATAQIVTLRKEGVVLVPRRAIRAENGKNYVLIPKAGAPANPQTGEPANDKREVTVGLSNSELIEVVSNLNAGEQVLVQDVVSTFNPIQN